MDVRGVLKHISLEVSDIARTEWFYDRFLGRLGFRRFVRDAGYLGYTDGQLTLWFVAGRSPRVHRKPPTGDEEVVADHLAFEVGSPTSVQELEAELAKADIYPFFRGEEHPEFRPGYFSAVWTDPDQVVLEVYAVATVARRPKARRSSAARKKKR
jgi:catechol 2,3-dioxygenase-like lactoylglutathione lyase family enzyme